MAKSHKKRQNIWQQYVAIAVAVVAVIIFGGWYYYSQYYLKPENVFWGMISQNLQTSAVTKTTGSADNTQTFSQVTDMQFKSQLAAHATVELKDTTAGSSSTIITETIGTPSQDFIKYNQVTSDNKDIPAGVVGAWAVNSATPEQPVQLFANELMYSPIMFGYLDHAQRAGLIKQMQGNKVFNIDFSAVNTMAKLGNKRVYSYQVSINLPQYLKMYQNYLKMLGQDELAGRVSVNDAPASLSVIMLVDPANRQLLQTTISDYATTETYSNFDINQPIEIPKDVKIGISELQSRLTGK